MTDIALIPSGSPSPPIDSEVPIHSYSVSYGTGHIDGPNNDPLQITVYIFDARTLPDGSRYRNELLILKDSVQARLPDAYQFPNGVIRFFAYESQLPAVLLLLQNSRSLWLKTRNGRVSIISGQELVN